MTSSWFPNCAVLVSDSCTYTVCSLMSFVDFGQKYVELRCAEVCPSFCRQWRVCQVNARWNNPCINHPLVQPLKRWYFRTRHSESRRTNRLWAQYYPKVRRSPYDFLTPEVVYAKKPPKSRSGVRPRRRKYIIGCGLTTCWWIWINR